LDAKQGDGINGSASQNSMNCPWKLSLNSIRYGNVRLIIFVQEDICGHISFLIEDFDSIHAAGVNGNYAKVKLSRFDADQRGTGYPNP
jgi:hypothetical protein